MARLSRVVAPGFPHHITQRGNRRQETFFEEEDYQAYREFMAEWCGKCGVAVWAYCLMTNHVHLIVVPENTDGLRRAIGQEIRKFGEIRGHLTNFNLCYSASCLPNQAM
jgi:putative transposase